MTEATMVAAPAEFRIGPLFSRSFDVLFRDFAKFFGICAVTWTPFLIFALSRGVPEGGMTPLYLGRVLASSVGFYLLWMGLSLFSQAIMLYGAVQQLRGQSFAIGQSLKYGLLRFLPILGVIVCFSAGVGLASLLLVVPGVILMLKWYMAVPVCVIENRGPIASLKRSGELTKGSRWKILGVTLLLGLASWLLQIVVQLVAAAVAGAVAALLATFLCSALLAAYRAVLVAVMYHDLRVAREGTDVERMAAVFE